MTLRDRSTLFVDMVQFAICGGVDARSVHRELDTQERAIEGLTKRNGGHTCVLAAAHTMASDASLAGILFAVFEHHCNNVGGGLRGRKRRSNGGGRISKLKASHGAKGEESQSAGGQVAGVPDQKKKITRRSRKRGECKRKRSCY